MVRVSVPALIVRTTQPPALALCKGRATAHPNVLPTTPRPVLIATMETFARSVMLVMELAPVQAAPSTAQAMSARVVPNEAATAQQPATLSFLQHRSVVAMGIFVPLEMPATGQGAA